MKKKKIGRKQIEAQTSAGDSIDWIEWKKLKNPSEKKQSDKNLANKIPVKLSKSYAYKWEKYDLKGWREIINDKEEKMTHKLKFLIIEVNKPETINK